VLPIVVIFVVVFGGIYGGKFTPTEGAAVGAAATFLAALAKREMTRQQVRAVFPVHGRGLGHDLHDLPGCRPDERGAGADPGAGPTGQPWCRARACRPGRWWAIVVFYLVLGCLMDELSILLLTIPIFFPAVMGWTSACPRRAWPSGSASWC
jgi:C4-dicarboxylate transporter DctM subunit